MDHEDSYIIKGTKEYTKLNIAFFLAGFTIFSVLYSVQPLMPYFVDIYGISETRASLVLSSSTVALALAMLVYGALSEVIGRRKIMIFSVISVTLFALVMPFVQNFDVLVFLRLVQGVCLAGLPAIAMAFISEEVSPVSQASAIGIYISGNAFGGAFGRIFTNYISSLYGLENGLLAISILSVIATVLFVVMLPPSRHFVKVELNMRELLGAYKDHLMNRALLQPFMLGLLLMGGNIALFNYISFELINNYGIKAQYVSFLYFLFLLGIISSMTIGRISNRFGIFNSLEYNLLLFIGGALITLVPSVTVKVIGLGLTIFGFFGGYSMASSMVGHRARDHHAQATSLYLLFYYTGTSLGGTVGGIFYSYMHWPGVVILAVVFMICALLILFNMKHVKNTPF